jgi:cellulose synthase (UDP-forming)
VATVTPPARPGTETEGRRRQGADRRRAAPSVLHRPVSERRVALGRLAIVVTIVAWIAYFFTWLFTDLLNAHHSTAIDRTESIVYLLVVTLPTASALAYLLSRLGFFYRARTHHRASRRELEEFYDTAMLTLTAIVPSYQEETRVVRNTLLSAALQEFPGTRVVLLIDDPPSPRGRKARELLDGARSLPGEIAALLAAPAAKFSDALDAFESAARADLVLDDRAMARLEATYDDAASWLEDQADRFEVLDHADDFLVNEVLLRLAGEFREVAAAVREASRQEVVLPVPRMRQLYRRLAWTFRAELSSFERKRYASLSSEPNKAANLNSYIGLMGGSYREVETSKGLALVPASSDEADLVVPDPDYVLTLDADSILLPDYCFRLVHLLERSEHQNVAIAQTPYTSFPGARTRLERIAGATTDVQHLLHQGLTYYDATFWVGANAVIRKTALDDIATTSYLGDWEVRHYISDRTVIEDTESTVDLGLHGWKLYNYPERLSYSATPPDFGSLCIQRRRWANGGLLILSKLRRAARARKANGDQVRFNERFLRWNYMASICWSTVSLLVLLAFPFNATLINPLLGVVALPYFVAMASDLRYCGHRRLDIARIYGLNLILLPVNLAGTVASLTQGITGSKSAFARTPKVRDRTVTPAFFLFAPYVLVALAGYTFWVAYVHGLDENMGYAALNILLALYAIVAFIGIRYSILDAWVHAKSLLYKRERPRRRRWVRRKSATEAPEPLDWQAVLQVGPAYARRWANASGVGLVGQGGGRWQLTGAMASLPAFSPSSDDHAGDARDDGPAPAAELDGSGATFRTVFQPVLDLTTRQVVGFEALTRFDDGTSPERWLEQANDAGARTALEGALARAGIEAATRLPKGGMVAIKASLDLLSEDTHLVDQLGALGRLVVVEMAMPSAAETAKAVLVAGSLPKNVRLALDHVGLDQWSASIVAALRPALARLRVDLVAGVAADKARQAQMRAMVAVMTEFGGELLAVGIETQEDCNVLRRLGVRYGQGYLLGRPEELVTA